MQTQMLAAVWSSCHRGSAGINKSLPVRTMLPDTQESHLNESRGKSSYQNLLISCAESPMYPVDKETKTTVGMGEQNMPVVEELKNIFSPLAEMCRQITELCVRNETAVKLLNNNCTAASNNLISSEEPQLTSNAKVSDVTIKSRTEVGTSSGKQEETKFMGTSGVELTSPNPLVTPREK